MKQSVIGAVTFGASSSATQKQVFGVMTAEWGKRISSNTEIPSAFRGKAILTQKPLLNQSSRGTRFSPESETAVIRTVVIRSI